MALELALAKRLKHFRVNTKHMSQRDAAIDAQMPLSTYVVAEGGRMGFKTKRRVIAWLTSVRKK